MDPFVKKAAATEDVLEEAFGESGEFCGQAYMLVYMRDNWCGELLEPVEGIPEANLDRLPQLLEKSPWSTDTSRYPIASKPLQNANEYCLCVFHAVMDSLVYCPMFSFVVVAINCLRHHHRCKTKEAAAAC